MSSPRVTVDRAFEDVEAAYRLLQSVMREKSKWTAGLDPHNAKAVWTPGAFDSQNLRAARKRLRQADKRLKRLVALR